jgi:large subunit ribosomal protein L21
MALQHAVGGHAVKHVDGSPIFPVHACTSGLQVEAEILEELRGPKVLVYKMRPKKHYRRTQGHRQELTKFMVTSITQTGSS